MYPQDLGLPGCWLRRGVLHGTPLDFIRSPRHLVKQAVCTAYEGHKPLTVSGKVNMYSTACLSALYLCDYELCLDSLSHCNVYFYPLDKTTFGAMNSRLTHPLMTTFKKYRALKKSIVCVWSPGM